MGLIVVMRLEGEAKLGALGTSEGAPVIVGEGTVLMCLY
jgi:hypothetical protein